MQIPPAKVYIVEDDPSVSSAYARLVRSAMMKPEAFTSVEDFLSTEFTDQNSCVVAGVRLPGKSGLELPDLLRQAGHRLPVIFVTAHDAAETREKAKSLGAAAYFSKPVDDQALLNAITWAISHRPRRQPQGERRPPTG